MTAPKKNGGEKSKVTGEPGTDFEHEARPDNTVAPVNPQPAVPVAPIEPSPDYNPPPVGNE